MATQLPIIGNPLKCSDWVHNPILAPLSVVKAGILSSLCKSYAIESCHVFATYMLFCGFQEEGCELLQELARRDGGKIHSLKRLMLETVWSRRPDLRFEVEGWSEPLSEEVLQSRRMELLQRICDAPKPTGWVPDGDATEVWRDTEDPYVAQACAYILSMPVDDDWPDDTTTGQALAALDKYRELCAAAQPVKRSHFSIALEINLNWRNRGIHAARAVVKRITSHFEDSHYMDSWMEECVCFENDIIHMTPTSSADLLKLSKADAGIACKEIITVLKQEANLNGPIPVPLEGVTWKELLERLARAMYIGFPAHWSDHDSVEKWEDILQPPATDEEIRKANGELKGLLPADFKEMVAVHNGFDAPADELAFLLSCAGISSMCLEDTSAVEPGFFPIPPPSDPTSPVTVLEFGTCAAPRTTGHTILVGPLDDTDDLDQQYFIPHETWKRHGDPTAAEGEYRYVHLGRGHSEWASFRHYVGMAVVTLEAFVAGMRAGE